MNTLELLREKRKSLPKGKKDPWGKCCPNKRVLLHRALKKDDLNSLTVGELEVVNELMSHIEKLEMANAKLEKKINKTLQQ